MAWQASDAVRNAQADALETTIGTAPILEIRTGAQPANCAAADSGTLLASYALPSDWLTNAGAVVVGRKDKNGTWTGTASGNGTAAHFRIKNSAGSVCHGQGSVTATGGGGDMTVDNTSFASGQTFTVTSFQYQRNNG